MNKYDDIKNRVSIVDYAKSIGLTPVKIGSFYTLKEHDSVRINTRRNIFYRNSTGECGSVIDFAICFAGKSLPEAIKELSEGICSEIKATNSQPIKEKKKDLQICLPEHDKTYKNIYAYLIQTRGINKEIVDFMIKNKMLYQDKHKNCVFVSYKEGIPKFACIRGTNTYKKFIADVSGSDYSYGFFMQFENSDRLIITESVIEALSYMCLDKKKADYLALAGICKFEESLTEDRLKKYREIIIALNNDSPGRKVSLQIKKLILGIKSISCDMVKVIVPKKENDWNDVLVNKKEKIKK